MSIQVNGDFFYSICFTTTTTQKLIYLKTAASLATYRFIFINTHSTTSMYMLLTFIHWHEEGSLLNLEMCLN